MKIIRFLLLVFIVGITLSGYLYGESLLKHSVQTQQHRTVSENPPSNKVQANPSTKQPKKTHSDQPGQTESESGSDQNQSVPPTAESDEYDSRRAEVIYVYDGDTVKVKFLADGETSKIRLQGIDCPESSEVSKCYDDDDLIEIPCEDQVPLGKRAKFYAERKLQDEIVRVESYNDYEHGSYGRTIAYLRLPNGDDYGLETVKKGYCKDSGVRYDHPRMDRYDDYRKPIKR